MEEKEDIKKETNEEKPKKSYKGIIIYIFILIIVSVCVSAITWHYAINFTMSSISNILTSTRQQLKEYIFAEYGKTDLNKKLVVLTQDVSVEIYKDKDNRILWDFLSVGSANMKIKFIDNKVQYYVPLNELKDSDVFYDTESRTVKIIAPSVKIDKDIVYVQTDPDKVIKEENGSWSPFGPNIKSLNNEIMKEIKQQTLIQGYKPWIRDKAQAEAQKALEDLFNKILSEFLRKENLKLEIILP